MKSPYKTKKRPCRICRKWFMPDPRPGKRQMTCGNTECKQQWHAKKCAEWNKKNREYFKSIYLEKKLTAASANKPKPKEFSEMKRKNSLPKSRINLGLPRKEVQEVIGLKSLVIIEYIVQLLLRRVQEVITV